MILLPCSRYRYQTFRDLIVAALCAAKIREVAQPAAKCVDCPGIHLVFDGLFGTGAADLEE